MMIRSKGYFPFSTRQAQDKPNAVALRSHISARVLIAPAPCHNQVQQTLPCASPATSYLLLYGYVSSFLPCRFIGYRL
ncbi:hypothetical protein K474DRAFT_1617864 [Panus rudis PR-1116 ss-1]|nr:hypothetical protein K474DRAFT_1617864 [Panus rudis PR-1116 ss-1]